MLGAINQDRGRPPLLSAREKALYQNTYAPAARCGEHARDPSNEVNPSLKGELECGVDQFTLATAGADH